MEYPRVLIISNNCLSQIDSNGRTLRNFLIGWPKDRLAQFYINRQAPDFSVCSSFYCVTDKQALRAFCGRGKSGGVVTEADFAGEQPKPIKQYSNRTALTMLARELVWKSGAWGYKSFVQWTKAFAPQVVLLQAGDCSFMFRLARKMARLHGIPLVIYNSEGYYFNKFDYFGAHGLAHRLYPIFYRQFAKEFRRSMAEAHSAVYICDALLRDYGKEFSLPAETIYTATTLVPAEKKPRDGLVISYLGNLGLGRHVPLIEIARALQEISPELHLDIYGKVQDPAVQAELEACPSVRLKGFVPYEQVVEIMQQSDLLIHGENRSDFYREELKYGFSTKIADSLASGTCFLLYAPQELACAGYLAEQEAAYVVSDPQTMKDTLRLLVTDPAARSRYLARAAEVVRMNHTAESCANKFQDKLRKASEKNQ